MYITIPHENILISLHLTQSYLVIKSTPKFFLHTLLGNYPEKSDPDFRLLTADWRLATGYLYFAVDSRLPTLDFRLPSAARYCRLATLLWLPSQKGGFFVCLHWHSHTSSASSKVTLRLL